LINRVYDGNWQNSNEHEEIFSEVLKKVFYIYTGNLSDIEMQSLGASGSFFTISIK
jgi:hypothetical protein